MTKDNGDAARRQITAADLEQYRQTIMNLVNENPQLFHPADIKRIHEDTLFCKRYMRAGKGNFDRAIEITRRALEWRKSFGVNDFDECSPQAATSLRHLSAGSIFPYGLTKSGAHVVMMRSRYHGKPQTPEERLEQQKLVAYIIESMVIKRRVKKIAFLFDCQHTGLSNTDIDGVKFIITLFRDYYPYLLERIYVVEMPWILQATWKLIKGLLPSEAQTLIVFISKEELAEDIAVESLPKWLGGTNEYCYKYVVGNLLGDNCPMYTLESKAS